MYHSERPGHVLEPQAGEGDDDPERRAEDQWAMTGATQPGKIGR